MSYYITCCFRYLNKTFLNLNKAAIDGKKTSFPTKHEHVQLIKLKITHRETKPRYISHITNSQILLENGTAKVLYSFSGLTMKTD